MKIADIPVEELESYYNRLVLVTSVGGLEYLTMFDGVSPDGDGNYLLHRKDRSESIPGDTDIELMSGDILRRILVEHPDEGDE